MATKTKAILDTFLMISFFLILSKIQNKVLTVRKMSLVGNQEMF